MRPRCGNTAKHRKFRNGPVDSNITLPPVAAASNPAGVQIPNLPAHCAPGGGSRGRHRGEIGLLCDWRGQHGHRIPGLATTGCGESWLGPNLRRSGVLLSA
jgi:hypothetical protein